MERIGIYNIKLTKVWREIIVGLYLYTIYNQLRKGRIMENHG
jgi:hypothetical protein